MSNEPDNEQEKVLKEEELKDINGGSRLDWPKGGAFTQFNMAGIFSGFTS